jgi:hypothetical protein
MYGFGFWETGSARQDQMHGWMVGCKHVFGWMDGWMGGWTGCSQMDGLMDPNGQNVIVGGRERERELEREMERERERETQSAKCPERERDTEQETGRKRKRQRQRKRGSERERGEKRSFASCYAAGRAKVVYTRHIWHFKVCTLIITHGVMDACVVAGSSGKPLRASERASPCERAVRSRPASERASPCERAVRSRPASELCELCKPCELKQARAFALACHGTPVRMTFWSCVGYAMVSFMLILCTTLHRYLL